MRFDVLYHFSSGSFHLIETKRLDLTVEAKPDEIYRWSLVEDQVISPLHFRSMSLSPQRRVFEEGWIEFDLQSCRGEILGRKLELTRQDALSETLKNLLELAYE